MAIQMSKPTLNITLFLILLPFLIGSRSLDHTKLEFNKKSADYKTQATNFARMWNMYLYA